MTNTALDSVETALGSGTGSFGTPTSHTVGTDPSSVAARNLNGLFDNDDDDDLVVANQGSANVSTLLADGTGGFGSPVTMSVGTGPRSVVIDNQNSDSNGLDIATADNAGNSVTAKNGNGAGNFGLPTGFEATLGVTSPTAIAAADLDEDGNDDVVTANSGGTMSAFLNMSQPDLGLLDFAGDFGTQPQSTASVRKIVVLSNTGDGIMRPTRVFLFGTNLTDWLINDDGCTGIALGFGFGCTIGLRFVPSAAGPRSATINVVANGVTRRRR